MSLKDSVAISNLGLGGADPQITNAAPSNNGVSILEGSIFDLNDGATPPKYLDNPPS
jgi:hypothetical protein